MLLNDIIEEPKTHKFKKNSNVLLKTSITLFTLSYMFFSSLLYSINLPDKKINEKSKNVYNNKIVLTDKSKANAPELEKIYIVSRQNNDKWATSTPKYPTVDDKVIMYPIIKANINDKIIYFSNTKNIKINGKKIPSKLIKEWDLAKYDEISLKWFKIEPTKKSYSNDNCQPGWWDKIKYKSTIFGDGNWQCNADVMPTIKDIIPLNIDKKITGTMRYKVEVKYNNKIISSPDEKSTGKIGIKPKVHMICVKGNTDNEYINWLLSYGNVPYIWGSASPKRGKNKDKFHQSEVYIGADCADLVVAAWRKIDQDVPYFGSCGFKKGGLFVPKFAEYIVDKPILNEDGVFCYNNQSMTFGKDSLIHPGDIIYFTGHVGVILQDVNKNKKLDISDTYIEILFDTTTIKTLKNRFSTDFSIIRWK